MNKKLLISFLIFTISLPSSAVKSPKHHLSDYKRSELKKKWEKERIAANKSRALRWYSANLDKNNLNEEDALKTFRNYLEMPLDDFLNRGDYKQVLVSKEGVIERVFTIGNVMQVFLLFKNIEDQITIQNLQDVEKRLRLAAKENGNIKIEDNLAIIAKLYVHKEKYLVATNLCYEVLLTSRKGKYLPHLLAYEALSGIPKKEAFLRLYKQLVNGISPPIDDSLQLRIFLLYKKFHGTRIDSETIVDLTKILPLLSTNLSHKIIPFNGKARTFAEHIKELLPVK